MIDDDRIHNSGSDPDSEQRRTGGSANDPHGGYEHNNELRGPDPDPVSELVKGSSGSLPWTQMQASERDGLASADSQIADIAANQLERDAHLQNRAQPGFGPTELDGAKLEGNPDLGIDPRQVRDDRPPQEGQGKHAGS